jgi:uncharacterized RmlC-like cupin family protein
MASLFSSSSSSSSFFYIPKFKPERETTVTRSTGITLIQRSNSMNKDVNGEQISNSSAEL